MFNTPKAILVIGAFYSFGTFGFFNLFDVRTAMQLLMIICITTLLIIFSRQVSMSLRSFVALVIFFFIYGLGMVAAIGTPVVLAETYCMLSIAILLINSDGAFILRLAKIIVSTSFGLCLLVAIAFAYYLLFPDAANQANLDIYGSTIGSEAIHAGNFADYLSFISGGYEVGGLNILRMKGYSNEPSATIVHYLAPCALAFMLGGIYVYLGIFCLIVNVVAISSFLGFLILSFSLPIYFLMRLKTGPLKTVVIWGAVIAAIYALQFDGLKDLQRVVGDWFYGVMQYDFLSRKEDSLDIRMRGFSADLDRLLSFPLGWWAESNAGVIFSLASKGGWILVIIYLLWVRKLFSEAEAAFNNVSRIGLRWGLSLAVSITLFATILSGYGWDRVPGVIMMLIFFKVLGCLGLPDSEPASRSVYKKIERLA